MFIEVLYVLTIYPPYKVHRIIISTCAISQIILRTGSSVTLNNLFVLSLYYIPPS